MSDSFNYTPAAFNRSLDEIRVRFPLIKEVIYSKKGEDTLDLIDRLEKLDENELTNFASGLKSDELDLPLVAFRTELDKGQSDKLESILRIRFRKKLFLLNWLILQNNYKNEKLNSSMQKLCGIMKDQYPEEYSESILAKIGIDFSDPVAKVVNLLKKEGILLSEFFEKYQLLHKSKFSYDFYVEFFTHCEAKDILDNYEFFILAINSYVVRESALVINTYLLLNDVKTYSDDVTGLVVSKYGIYDAGSEFWGYIGEEQKTKFEKWLNLDAMQRHFGKDSRKCVFWSSYINDISRIEEPRSSPVIFIFFETCVVVDLGEPEQFAYLYYKEAFEMEYEHFMAEGSGGAWRIFRENVIDARESVIEEKRSDVYKLSYEFVGRLYLKELLETEALKKKKRTH